MLEYIPRQHLRARLLEGWSLVPGHEYSPGDYAILMLPPSGEKPTQPIVNRIEKWFSPPSWRSNKSAAGSSLHEVRYRREMA